MPSQRLLAHTRVRQQGAPASTALPPSHPKQESCGMQCSGTWLVEHAEPKAGAKGRHLCSATFVEHMVKQSVRRISDRNFWMAKGFCTANLPQSVPSSKWLLLFYASPNPLKLYFKYFNFISCSCNVGLRNACTPAVSLCPF